LQDKLDRLVGKSSGYLESLPKKVKNRVENLKKIQVFIHAPIDPNLNDFTSTEKLEMQRPYLCSLAQTLF
jgi:hypothetical protein